MDEFELIIKDFEPLLNKTFKEKPTFLNVIGKDYAEVYMSALVSYALLKDENLLKNLIKLYYSKFENKNIEELLEFDLSNVSSSLEKGMGKKRADIFVEITNDENNVVTTVTIENKTNTTEHSDQTVNYYNWVKNNFADANNLFFYLYPDYNESKAGSDAYYNLKYSDLNKYITNTDDYIILDLKQHIKQRMEVDSMEIKDNEKYIIDKFNDYSNIMENLSRKIIKKKEELIKAFTEKFEEEFCIVDWHKAKGFENSKPILYMEKYGEKNQKIGTESFRLYKGNWYLENKYYLYVEIKFHDTENGPFDKITFQQTIKKYNNFSDFDNWKDKNGIKEIFKESFSNYHVLNYKEFNCSKYDWNSEEWKNQFVNQANDYFKEMLKSSDSIYETLQDFFSNN